MLRFLRFTLLFAFAGCARALSPDASESCGAGQATGGAAKLPQVMHTLYSAESLCRLPEPSHVTRVTLGAPVSYDSATREPALRLHLDRASSTGEVRWGAYRPAASAPFRSNGSGVAQLSPQQLEAFWRALDDLKASRDDSTQCIHCFSVIIEERRGDHVDWFTRPMASLEEPQAIAAVRNVVLVALRSDSASK
jgi:hypothetical protein